MSIEHDNLPVDPRLDLLLRQITTANDLQPAQKERVRDRLGLLTAQPSGQATLTIPVSRAQLAATNSEFAPIAAPPRAKLRRQWLQFALAAIAFIAAGVVLALVFGSGSDDAETRAGTDGTPEATATISGTLSTISADPAQIVRDALAPLPPEQEWRIVLDVEAHNQHDNAFDQWTIEMWQRWSADGVPDHGLFVSDPAGEVVAHIVLDGEQRLLNWEPRDGRFDTPLEFSLQQRVLGATLAAVNDPESHHLQREERDGRIVLSFEWQDDQAREFNYVSRSEAWIDPESSQLLQIVHLVDRPDQEPYPTRTFVFRDMQILPAGSSPAGTYELGGLTVAPTATALPTPDEMGMYRDITLEQAQAIVPFEIVVPEPVPDGFDAPSIIVIEAPQVSGEPNYRVERSDDRDSDRCHRTDL